MAIFNITADGYGNLPPTRVGNKTIELLYNETYVFSESDFTTGTTPAYSDPEGDNPFSVKIISIPSKGVLNWYGGPASPGNEVPISDISSGNLTYVSDSLDTDGYTNSELTFNVSDEGSQSFGSITPGIVTINVAAKVNLKPSAVGNNTLSLNYGESKIFTRTDFTTNTTPAYSDPEGDAAGNLKVISLPSIGTLKLNGVSVTANQIIPFSSIDSGFFTYSPNVSVKTSQTLTFNFSISDVGSGLFTS